MRSYGRAADARGGGGAGGAAVAARAVHRGRRAAIGPALLLAGLLAGLLAWVYGPAFGRFYYYDDAVMLLDAQRVLDGEARLGSGGGFGRFRPLRELFFAAGTAAWGADRPAFFRVPVFVLHLANAVLLVTLIERVLAGGAAGPTRGPSPPATPATDAARSTRRAVAVGAGAVFLLHASGSEAVTYLSAVGVVCSTTGFLLLIHAALPWTWGKPRGSAVRLVAATAGAVLLLGSGRYGLALLPGGLLLAAARGPVSRSRLTVLAAAAVGLATAMVLLPRTLSAGAAATAGVADAGLWARQTLDLLSRQVVPARLIDERWGGPVVAVTVAAAGLAAVAVRLRGAFDRRAAALAGVWVAAALLYGVNGLVLGGRFSYPASGFAAASLLLLLSWRVPANGVWAGAVLLTAAHAVCAERRLDGVAQRSAALSAFDRALDADVGRGSPVRVDGHDPEHAGAWARLRGHPLRPPGPGPGRTFRFNRGAWHYEELR